MNNSTLIEKYFSGILTPKELLEFEKLYESDSEFKKEVDFLKNIKSVSEKEDDKKFKNELKTFESEFITKNKTHLVTWLKPIIAIAAILLIAFYIHGIYNAPINEDQLFAEYFEPSKNVSTPIVRSDVETSLNDAFAAYNNSDYKEAVILFENAYLNSKNTELLFYEGNALLALGNNNDAIIKFKQHLTYSDILTNRSHWYLALAYLKTKKVDLAKQELHALINSGENFKKAEAKKLFKKLN